MISGQNRSCETVLEQQSTAGDITISHQRRLRASYARQFQALPGHYSDRLLEEQLGLRLEPQKVPVSLFVIESAQKPSPN